jgi:uncharacterized protein (TIGR02328 family)
MRIWSYQILPYLPDLQFKGQFRELIAIMHDWRDKSTTNHLLINKVMEYPKSEIYTYYLLYSAIYYKRYEKGINNKYDIEFKKFANNEYRVVNDVRNKGLFANWHTKEHLREEMANLHEKHFYGIGKSRITDDEWDKLLTGYKNITGEDYVI